MNAKEIARGIAPCRVSEWCGVPPHGLCVMCEISVKIAPALDAARNEGVEDARTCAVEWGCEDDDDEVNGVVGRSAAFQEKYGSISLEDALLSLKKGG